MRLLTLEKNRRHLCLFFSCSWGSFLPSGVALPNLAVRALSYYILLYRVNCCLLEAYSFLMRGGGGGDGGDRAELGGEERGNCGLVVYNREEFIFN